MDHREMFGEPASEITKSKPGPGRPRMRRLVDADEYKFIVESPSEPDRITEIIISEPIVFLRYMMTLKSNGTDSLDIFVSPDTMTICGCKEHRPTSINSAVDTSEMHISIKGKEIYSFYNRAPITVAITAMAELIGIMEYLDQYSERVTLFLREGVSNRLFWIVYNSNLLVTVESGIECVISPPPLEFDCRKYSIDFDFSDINVKFEDYIAEHFKKLLVKKSIKSSNSFKLIAKGSSVSIEIMNDKGIKDVLTFNITNNKNIINMKPAEIYSVHFPKNDILNFIIHIKAKINIYMNRESILMKHSDGGMDFYSSVRL